MVQAARDHETLLEEIIFMAAMVVGATFFL